MSILRDLLVIKIPALKKRIKMSMKIVAIMVVVVVFSKDERSGIFNINEHDSRSQ